MLLINQNTAAAGTAEGAIPPEQGNSNNSRYLMLLTLGALGIVYGDIGTSPLYAMKECFGGHHPIPPTIDNVLGVLSLITWALIIEISLKYILFVMRADNRGEGGVLALMALAAHPQQKMRKSDKRNYLIIMGLFGAALLYGDGIITPAISVLSAVEGLKVVTPLFEPYIIPITVTILLILFSCQRGGTAKIGAVFGPVILTWFSVLGLLGIINIAQAPHVLLALNPLYAISFFTINGWKGFVVLGSVFLVVTGGEALYADMGHFGKKPIRYGWFAVVLPGLLLNYYGQGALLLTSPESAVNPFYHLAPSWALIPLVILATLSTVIASQALITGAFSLTHQAVQLNCFPRLTIQHTSSKEKGQIYVPLINQSLLFMTILLVVYFGSSSNMAAAYGIAVSTTMVITTILTFFVAREIWDWSIPKAALITGAFLAVDLIFFSANIIKIHHGGWVPLVIGLVVFTLMSTWRTGRKILAKRLKRQTTPLLQFIEEIRINPPRRVPGTAIFMTGNIEGTPPALVHNLRHNKVLHETVVFLMVMIEEIPYYNDSERVKIEKTDPSIYRVIVHYGFMEEPDVPTILNNRSQYNIEFETKNPTFFLGRETLLATKRKGMALWRERLFTLMMRNAARATTFYRIPSEQVIEIGLQIEL